MPPAEGRRRRVSRKLDRACGLIDAAIAQGEFGNDRPFPSTRALAGMCGVSRFTAWQATRRLLREGRLAKGLGDRLSLPKSGDAQASPRFDAQAPARRAKYHDVRERMERDVLTGRFAAGTAFASVKELASGYGVSRPTIRKALEALVDESVLVRTGSRYHPQATAAPRTVRRPRIVLIGFGVTMQAAITQGYWHIEYVKLLELECAKAAIALDIVCFARIDGKLRFTDGRTGEAFALVKNSAVLGYLIEVSTRECADQELIRMLAACNAPVAILDEMGTYPSPRDLMRGPSFRVFRNTLADVPARQVARFALELGHRRAVFISPYHRLEFSIRRLGGVRETFALIDDAEVTPVTFGSDATDDITEGVARTRLDAMAAFYAGWKKDLPAAYTVRFDRHFESWAGLSAGGLVYERLDALFAKALAINDVTIWIMVNDECASYAIDFLRQREIAVPDDLSVISFDDLPEALEKGISSYNFNQAATVAAMLRFILTPRLYSSRRPIFEIEGKLIPRRTTGLPRKKIRLPRLAAGRSSPKAACVARTDR